MKRSVWYAIALFLPLLGHLLSTWMDRPAADMASEPEQIRHLVYGLRYGMLAGGVASLVLGGAMIAQGVAAIERHYPFYPLYFAVVHVVALVAVQQVQHFDSLAGMAPLLIILPINVVVFGYISLTVIVLLTKLFMKTGIIRREVSVAAN